MLFAGNAMMPTTLLPPRWSEELAQQSLLDEAA